MSLNLKHSFGAGDITAVAILPDAMLVLEHLEGESALQPRVAIGRRRHQLEQLME